MSLNKIADFLRKELTESTNTEVSRFIKRLIIEMKNNVRPIELSSEHYTHHCQKGCCEDNGTNIFIDGEHVCDIDEHINPLIIKTVLEHLGYNIEEKLFEDMPYKLN